MKNKNTITIIITIIITITIATSISLLYIRISNINDTLSNKISVIIMINFTFIIAVFMEKAKVQLNKEEAKSKNIKEKLEIKKLQNLLQGEVKISYEGKDIQFIVLSYKELKEFRYEEGIVKIYKDNDIYMTLPYNKYLKYIEEIEKGLIK